MGAWGPAIFSDDFACDVRDAYVKEIILGKTSEEATALIKAKLLPPADVGMDEIPVFWIALAITQWKKGRLLPEVRDEALTCIDSGVDLLRWASEPEKVIRKRKDALEKAKQTLLSPMPPAKKIPMPSWMKDDPWQLGDLISYKITREDLEYTKYIGKYVVLRIAEARPLQSGGPKSNLYAVYQWYGDSIPTDLSTIKERGYIEFRKSGDAYISMQCVFIDKRDIKERDMRVLESEDGFNPEDDEFLRNGGWDGAYGGPLPFDYHITKWLHEHENEIQG